MRARRLLRRRTLHAIAAVLVTLGALGLADLVSVTVPAPASDRPLHHGRVGFRNVDPDYAYSLTSRIAHVVGRLPAPPRGRPLEVVPNDLDAAQSVGDAADDVDRPLDIPRPAHRADWCQPVFVSRICRPSTPR